MKKSWYDTTWTMNKIELRVVDIGLLEQLDMCAVI